MAFSNSVPRMLFVLGNWYFLNKVKTLWVGIGIGGNKTKENLVFDIGKKASEGSGLKTNCQVSSLPCLITKSLVVAAEKWCRWDVTNKLRLSFCCPTHQHLRTAVESKNQPVNRNCMPLQPQDPFKGTQTYSYDTKWEFYSNTIAHYRLLRTFLKLYNLSDCSSRSMKLKMFIFLS